MQATQQQDRLARPPRCRRQRGMLLYVAKWTASNLGSVQVFGRVQVDNADLILAGTSAQSLIRGLDTTVSSSYALGAHS